MGGFSYKSDAKAKQTFVRPGTTVAAAFRELYGLSIQSIPTAAQQCYCVEWYEPRLPRVPPVIVDRLRKRQEPDHQPQNPTSANDGNTSLPPKMPRAPARQRMNCYCNFTKELSKRLKLAEHVFQKHNLIANPLDELEKDSIKTSNPGRTTKESPAQYQRQPWQATEGKYMISVSGTKMYQLGIQKLMRSWPAEVFLLFAMDDMIKLNNEKERMSGIPFIRLPNTFNIEPLDSFFQSRYFRFTNHLRRIYGPGWENLKKLPKMYEDGVQLDLAGRIYKNVLDGGALNLGGQMFEQAKNMVERARKSRDEGNKDGEGPP